MRALGIPNLENMLDLIKSTITLELSVLWPELSPISKHNQQQAKCKQNRKIQDTVT